jgi:hypothetical protein
MLPKTIILILICQLEHGRWQEANEETILLLPQIAIGFNTANILHSCKFDNLKCDGLLTINLLWLEYSREHFGFSVQRQIWHEVEEDYGYFLHHVGWLKTGTNFRVFSDPNIPRIAVEELTYSLTDPRGHLPCFLGYLPFFKSLSSEWAIHFFAHVMKCQI